MNLLQRSKRFLSKTRTTSAEDAVPKPKRSSTSDGKQYTTVNIPVPYRKVRFKPIHVAYGYGYSKKPDVYIQHLHVHNGGKLETIYMRP